MWAWAAESSTSTGPSDVLITAIFTLAGTIVITLGTVIVQAIRSRAEKTAPSPPAPSPDADALGDVREDVAVLRYRADDSDREFELLDRTTMSTRHDVDDVIRYLNRAFPGWRN